MTNQVGTASKKVLVTSDFYPPGQPPRQWLTHCPVCRHWVIHDYMDQLYEYIQVQSAMHGGISWRPPKDALPG